jgi:hypothetical protein
MNKQFLLSTLVALSAAFSFSQASAIGQTYDSCENYYSQYYYTIESDTPEAASVKQAVEVQAATDSSYSDDYYAKYYGTESTEAISSKTLVSATEASMADPGNYYNW